MALLVVACSFASRAQAQTSTEVQYSQLIQTALAEYDAGRWADARGHFRQAHLLDPGARTLRAIGYASFELEDYADTVRSLTLALAESRRPLTPEQRTAVTELLARAEAFVGRITLTLTPSDARVLVDGEPVPLLEGVLIADAGEHGLTFEAPNHAPETRTVTITAGRTDALTVSLRSTGVAVETRPAREEAPRRARTVLTPVGWALVGFAGASAVVSLGTGIRGEGIYNEVDGRCVEKVCPPTERDEINRGRALVAWSTATTVLTVASGATGAVFLILERGRSGDEEAPAVEVTSGPGEIGVGARVRF